MNGSSIESRLQRLEDMEAIRQLQATYADHIDQGWNGKTFRDVSALFSDDATFDCEAFNLHAKGNRKISDTLKQASTFQIAQHSFTNPVITIDGDKATAKWMLWVGVNGDGTSNMIFESEDIEYVRTTKGWLIQSIRLYVVQMLKS